VWKSKLGERELEFELVGINNQNFIMADERSGTWWQQVSGRSIRGPLHEARLELQPFEQVTWEVWREEHPDTLVLESREEFFDDYWTEKERGWRDGSLMEFVTEADPDDPLAQGDLIVAAVFGREQKAYPMATLRDRNPVTDEAFGVPVLLAVGRDGRSVRCFDRRLDGETLELFRNVQEVGEGAPEPQVELIDAASGSVFNFAGEAISGPLAGKRLRRVTVYTDYWFDWKQHNPDGPLFRAGL
jgi:hypothetical protein